LERPYFATIQAYGGRFTDSAYWRPYVEEACRRHGLNHSKGIRSGLPGTHPVFLVGGRYVVKFFSDLFAGDRSFAIEREIYLLLEQDRVFPAAHLIADGSLFSSDGGWHWPYLISTLLPGASLSETYDRVDYAEREGIARDLGRWLRQLHHTALENAVLLRPDWTPFCAWLDARRTACMANHRRWQSLSARLIEQIDDYLPEVETLVDRVSPPLLLHCDMNADHLLGELIDGRWASSGIIDYGDARVGDFLYELVALHLGLFRGDMRLLRIFLQTYGSNADQHPAFAARAMAYTLLHEFNVLESVGEFVPELERIQTLNELATRIWT
jgi:hygromycin-B 7''-O-kinase